MRILLILTLLSGFILSVNTYAQRILLSQGFENGPYTADSLPLKWAKVKVNGPGLCNTAPLADWRVRDSGTVFCQTNSSIPAYRSKAFNSLKSLSIPWSATSGSIADDWVFTDSLRIAGGDSLIFRVQLGTYFTGGGIYFLDSLQIWVCSGQTPASQISRLGTVASLPFASNGWQLKIYNLSAFSGQRIYIAFRYYMDVSFDGIMVNVDSVMIRNLSGPPVAIENNNNLIPAGFDLKQNYPNPFNPSTSIFYDLPGDEFVNITVYNSVGQQVAVLINEHKEAGAFEIKFDALNLPGGIYLCRMRAGDYTKSVKMSLIK